MHARVARRVPLPPLPAWEEAKPEQPRQASLF
jgi:hypothetical protein